MGWWRGELDLGGCPAAICGMSRLVTAHLLALTSAPIVVVVVIIIISTVLLLLLVIVIVLLIVLGTFSLARSRSRRLWDGQWDAKVVGEEV